MAEREDDILASLDFAVEAPELTNNPDLTQLFQWMLDPARTLAIESYLDAQKRSRSEELALALAEVTFQFVLEYLSTEDDDE